MVSPKLDQSSSSRKSRLRSAGGVAAGACRTADSVRGLVCRWWRWNDTNDVHRTAARRAHRHVDTEHTGHLSVQYIELGYFLPACETEIDILHARRAVRDDSLQFSRPEWSRRTSALELLKVGLRVLPFDPLCPSTSQKRPGPAVASTRSTDARNHGKASSLTNAAICRGHTGSDRSSRKVTTTT